MQTEDLVAIEPAWLEKWNVSVPRYTSYPTAPQFHVLEKGIVAHHFSHFGTIDKPLSLYIHIPFCKSMCLFCGCSVILNRRPEKQAHYLKLLLKELDLVASFFPKKKRLSQLHLGGGTPTSFDEEQLCCLMRAVQQTFLFEKGAEISIEVDPRTVFADQAEKLKTLKQLGFNRISFGVQDLDPNVQEAVKRRQSEEMTVSTFLHARRLGFDGINIDLIYGLPLQTQESFQKTAVKILELKPDRISFFSYAKVPWLKAHQKAIREADLPSSLEKFQIYATTRRFLMENGYVAIGMDHFAQQSDTLAEAYREERLIRNFQGYSVGASDDLIGLGVSAIGFVNGMYVQNVKSIEEYESQLEKGHLPILRGFLLGADDVVRKWVIGQMMCCFRVDKEAFEREFHVPFDHYFASERKRLQKELVDRKSVV